MLFCNMTFTFPHQEVESYYLTLGLALVAHWTSRIWQKWHSNLWDQIVKTPCNFYLSLLKGSLLGCCLWGLLPFESSQPHEKVTGRYSAEPLGNSHHQLPAMRHSNSMEPLDECSPSLYLTSTTRAMPSWDQLSHRTVRYNNKLLF